MPSEYVIKNDSVIRDSDHQSALDNSNRQDSMIGSETINPHDEHIIKRMISELKNLDLLPPNIDTIDSVKHQA